MGIKLLNLQMIPWCFHLMGNHMPCMHIRGKPPPPETIKIIKSDGLVQIYDRPINVSEVLVEYPKHLVCRSDSFYIGQKIPALSDKDQLQLGHKYFLLPKHCFQSVLSFVTIASFVNTTSCSAGDSRNALLKKAAASQPFDIQKSPSGCLRIRVSDEFITELMEQGQLKQSAEDEASSANTCRSRVCTTAQLQKDYSLLVRSRQWKPKLETIREKEKKRLSSFGMKRRRKSQSTKLVITQKVTHKSSSEHHLHVTPSTKSSSKSKMKIKLRK